MSAAGSMRILAAFVVTTSAISAALPAAEPAVTPQQIEADWLLQDVVRKLPSADPNTAQRTAVTTAEDAAGAVDGIKAVSYTHLTLPTTILV